jgi:hypothetical protein
VESNCQHEGYIDLHGKKPVPEGKNPLLLKTGGIPFVKKRIFPVSALR